jgi:hypothetical protein
VAANSCPEQNNLLHSIGGIFFLIEGESGFQQHRLITTGLISNIRLQGIARSSQLKLGGQKPAPAPFFGK